MSAILHIRCSIIGCNEVVDCVIPKETWGVSHPGDTGCGDVTLYGEMSQHVADAHSSEDVLRTLVAHHERTAAQSAATAANLRERFPEVFQAPAL